MLIPIEGTSKVDGVVIDLPIRGIAINQETKEIRFVLADSDAEALNGIEFNYSDIPLQECGYEKND